MVDRLIHYTSYYLKKVNIKKVGFTKGILQSYKDDITQLD